MSAIERTEKRLATWSVLQAYEVASDLRAVLALAKEAAGQRHIARQYGRALARFISIADHAHVESLLEGDPDSFAGRLRNACRARVLLDLRKPLPKRRRIKP